MGNWKFKKGEYSFKNWFKLGWKNRYVQICVVALIAMIYQITHLGTMVAVMEDNIAYSTMGGIMTSIAMLIPSAVFIITAFKGLYQHYKDMQNGTSR